MISIYFSPGGLVNGLFRICRGRLALVFYGGFTYLSSMCTGRWEHGINTGRVLKWEMSTLARASRSYVHYNIILRRRSGTLASGIRDIKVLVVVVKTDQEAQAPRKNN